MQWSFKALTAFTQYRTSLSPSSSRSAKQEKLRAPPLQDSSNGQSVTIIQSEVVQETSSQECHCGNQPTDFCPYCDHQQAVQSTVVLSVVELSSNDFENVAQASSTAAASDPTSRRRKLRKIKPDYQQIRLQSSTDTHNTATMNSPKPESFQSTNSRTPLLNPFARPVAHYPPLPEEPRTPKKLEKRDKRRRTKSTTGFYGTRSGISSAENNAPHLRPPLPNRSAQRPQSAYESATFSRTSSILGTDALVALAWTGEIQQPAQSTPNDQFPELPVLPVPNVNPFDTPPTAYVAPENLPERRPRVRAKSDSSSSHRRSSIFRRSSRFADAQEVPLPPPWNLAKALTDDSLSDEKLVDHLEDMRIKEEPRPTSLLSTSDILSYQSILNESYVEYSIEPGEVSPEPSSPTDSTWNSARQALLLCREMIKTERRYQTSLRLLVKGGTTTSPPVSMLLYLPALIRASDAFLQSMTSNPSVQGVSEAFMSTYHQMDEAFARWCAVVGVFFFTPPEESNPGSPSRRDSADASDVSRSSSWRLRSSSRQSMRSRSVDSHMNDIKLEPNKIRRNTRGRPTVRELAILPTQRIARYVLLFKELLALTPPNVSSYPVVEEAFRSAQSIARKADDAQKYSSGKVSPP